MTADTGYTPDPEGAAARVLGNIEAGGSDTPPADDAPRRVGRPPGSKNKKKRDHRAEYAKRKGKDRDEPDEPIEPPTDEDIAASAFLAGTIWKLVGPFARLTPLSPDEEQTLGRALAPVLQKYVPALDEWQAEVTLAVVVIGLYGAHKVKRGEVEAGGFIVETPDELNTHGG